MNNKNPNGIEIRSLDELSEELDKLSEAIVSPKTDNERSGRPKHVFQSSSVVLSPRTDALDKSSHVSAVNANSKSSKSLDAINTARYLATTTNENIGLEKLRTTSPNRSRDAGRENQIGAVEFNTTSRF